MNSVSFLRRTKSAFALGWIIALAGVNSTRADFAGPYAVTPPDPGLYGGLPFHFTFTFGNWTAFGNFMFVNTSNAPSQIELSVPAHTTAGGELNFQTFAAGTGTVSFDSTAISTAPGFIEWYRIPTLGSDTHVLLDAGPRGTRHFSFPVEAGDIFGFDLYSGGDVVNQGDPTSHTLSLANFSAPVPEPGVAVLLATGFALIAIQVQLHRTRAV